MHFTSLSTLLSTLSLSTLLTVPFTAAQLITSDTHSFGGVNYPLLQYLDPPYRDEAILAIVKSKARVIRLFIRPDTHHSDPEPQIGEFDKSLLDQLDDALAAIHRISNGTVKVILAPHDARALRGTEGVPCDAYCEKIGGAFLDFYSSEEVRKLYKTRLDVFFKHYPSKNFRGRSWSTLSEVILGVDIQHAPFTPIFPIPAGESWLCDMATHLSSSLALKKSNIAVISGGVSGHMSSPDDIRNMPDSVWGCEAIDVIGIHGRFKREEGVRTAGTAWAEMFVPGNTLMGRAAGRAQGGKSGKGKGKGKLLLVEEWEYVDADGGVERKREDVYDQGLALNLRGVPWLYSHLSPRPAENTSRINPLPASQPSNALLTNNTSVGASAFSALAHLLRRAHTARSTFDWTRFLPAPAIPLVPLSLKEIPLNPFVHEAHTASRCVFGCPGHLCSAADGCAPDLLCHNNICVKQPAGQPGQMGARCDSKKPCQTHLRCEKGVCGACAARKSLDVNLLGEKTGMCEKDGLVSPPICLAPPSTSTTSSSIPSAADMRSPVGLLNPCTLPSHCSYSSYCSQAYTCTPCLPGDACAGSPCTSSNACRTGFCNEHGRCDYADKQKKRFLGPKMPGGKSRRVDGVPRGHERGPARVRSEALRVEIPGERVVATGVA